MFNFRYLRGDGSGWYWLSRNHSFSEERESSRFALLFFIARK